MLAMFLILILFTFPPVAVDQNHFCSASQKHKSDGTSNSSIEQEKENIDRQDTEGQGGDNRYGVATTVSAAQDFGAGSKDIGKAQLDQNNSSGRAEVPRWVLEEIEVNAHKFMFSLIQKGISDSKLIDGIFLRFIPYSVCVNVC